MVCIGREVGRLVLAVEAGFFTFFDVFGWMGEGGEGV